MFKFIETENTVEKYQWCLDYIGSIGNKWSWDLKQSEPTRHVAYRRTAVIICIESEIDALAYKLRWS